MSVFEDKLRARQVTHVGYHAHDRAISMTEKERNALADAVEALRFLAVGFPEDSDDPTWTPLTTAEQKAVDALARLDAV